MWWRMTYKYHIHITFLSPCKLCTICLLRCFFSNSILFRWVSLIYFNFRGRLLWLFIWHILKAIWNSMHWHLSISVNSKILNCSYFFIVYKYFFWKNKTFIHDQSQSCAQLFGTSINLLQLIISLLSLFIHPEASIGVLGKRLFEYWSTYQLKFLKNSFGTNFAKLSSKTLILQFFIRVHLQAF